MIRPSLPALATCWSPGEYATAATASAWPTSDFSLDLRFRSQMVTSVAAPAEARYRLPLLNASARTGGATDERDVVPVSVSRAYRSADASGEASGMRPRSSPEGFRRCARPSAPPHASAPFVGLHSMQ